MPPSSTAIDWETLKPEILRLLSIGKTRRDVLKEVSKDGPSITKSQLEYQLKCWGRRTNLTEHAWRYASYKVQKRARNKKDSAVFFNGALIPKAKVVKETRRHDRPTMLPAPGASPKLPEGFDLIIRTPPPLADSPFRNASPEAQHCLLVPTRTFSSLPWLKFVHGLRGFVSISMRSNIHTLALTTVPKMYQASLNLQIPTLSQFPATLINLSGMHEPPFGVEQFDNPHMALLGCSESDQTAEGEVVPHKGVHYESQIVTLLGLQIFQISNKLSTGLPSDDDERLSKLGDALKTVVRTRSGWEGLLTAGAGATSKSLIEQLFEYSVTDHDRTLAKLTLQVGADPDQQIYDRELKMCVPALDFAINRNRHAIANLLLDSGAVYGQTSLKHAIIAGAFDIADRMLQSDPSLDLNFNYLGDLDRRTIRSLDDLKLETVTLLGLVSLHSDAWYCSCHKPRLSFTNKHAFGCGRYEDIASLRYLLGHGAAITTDTMIMASLGADIVTLRFLIQHGGNVCGFNHFGFLCLDAASLGAKLHYDVFSLLLESKASINIPRTHHAFGSQASPLHRLLSRQNWDLDSRAILSIGKLLIDSGADINYLVQHLGSSVELDEAYDKFLWAHSAHHATTADSIAQSNAESLLEYAIISGHEDLSLNLVSQGCQLTGREITLAVKMGLRSLLKALLKHGWWDFSQESIRRTCLRLALRWGHETIVRFLIGEGVKFGEQDVIDALQCPGRSSLSTKTQIELIRATPNLDRLQIFGLPSLELCFSKFEADAVREILRRFPAAYDSGALFATVLRALQSASAFDLTDVQTMISRRAENNCDWEKENAALLVAAVYQRPDLVRVLVTPDTPCIVKTARLPKTDFTWLLYWRSPYKPLEFMGANGSLGFQDWVSCSPLIGIPTKIFDIVHGSVSEDILEHLLACSYEPDALTVVIAAAQGNLVLLRRFQCLVNWRSILNIDDHNRPPWCPTALQAAALNWGKDLVEFLLDAGAGVNEMPASEPIGECMPRTALQAAVGRGKLMLTKLLIERGACINAPAAEDSGATALQLACIHGYLEISRLLLELGADVNARWAQKHGRTALEGAAEHGRIDTIQLLLSCGACTDGSYREQYLNAILYAKRNRHFAAAALLKEHRVWSTEDEECYRRLQ